MKKIKSFFGLSLLICLFFTLSAQARKKNYNYDTRAPSVTSPLKSHDAPFLKAKPYQTTDNLLTTPDGRPLTPAGELISYGSPDTEHHAMDNRLSPDGKILAVQGRFNLVLVDTKTKKTKIIPTKSPTMYSGITWSKNGKHIYWTASSGDILDAQIGKDENVTISKLYSFKADPNDATEQFSNGKLKPVLPNEITIDQDGSMYVVLDGLNKIAKLNNGNIQWKTAVGKFPYGIVSANAKLYVTDWGGRNPKPGDYTALAGWNNPDKDEDIVADDETGEAAASGEVTVLDPLTGNIIRSIEVGTHPNDIVSSPNGKRIYVANGNDDTVSVINTDNDKVVETIKVCPAGLFGCTPNALAVSPDGRYLYVADGMINAVAVVKLHGSRAYGWNRTEGSDTSKVVGFIPTGAYPGGLDVSKDGKTLFIADTEGVYSRATTSDTTDAAFQLFHGNGSTAGAYNTHRQLGYISIVPLSPHDPILLKRYTVRVMKNLEYDNIFKTIALKPRKKVEPVPVPERLGEPSVFKHVIYIIKENRSYDQVFGDMTEGNGDPDFCVFGKKVTPNQHELAKEFELMDNFYDMGKCSAEGHPWVDSAYTTDFVEKNVRGWFRGYYHVILDAMVTPKTGYIWDGVLKKGLSFENFGEGLKAEISPKNVTWSDIYNAYEAGNLADAGITIKNKGTISYLVKYASQKYLGYDHHKIPDALRARDFIKELKKYEEKGTFPSLIIMALPANHTAGIKPGYPTPEAMVADNDLALGKIVDALSRSKFYKDTAIFVVEDDTQNGWDHVSAFRGPALVISPYSRLGKAVHTRYSQLSIIHTIEQILGIKPMNLFDLSAPLMKSCFTDTPDLTPYMYVQNQVMLDEMNPSLGSLSGKHLKWAKIADKMSMDLDDSNNDDILNKMIWYSVKGYNTPYPKYPN